jgi:hypothetical protein
MKLAALWFAIGTGIIVAHEAGFDLPLAGRIVAVLLLCLAMWVTFGSQGREE